MAIRSPLSKKSDFEIVPAGNHIARLYSVVHIGTIPGEYMGQSRETDTIRLSFELPEETRVFKEGSDPQPMVISQEFTNSMHEKANLGKLVRGMAGVEWHPNEDTESIVLDDFLGMACMLNVIHKTSKTGNEYATIVSAAPLPKGIEAKPQVNPNFSFDYEEGWSQEKFEKFPDFIKDKMRTSHEYKVKFGLIEPEEAPEAKWPVDDEINPEDIPF